MWSAFAIFLAIAPGCGSEHDYGPPSLAVSLVADASPPSWRLIEVFRLGTETEGGAPLFGQVTSLAVDRLGRVYVADAYSQTVFVVDSSGTAVRRLGRFGEGPGELAWPFGIAFQDDSTLWIVDIANSRYSVYDTTGSHIVDVRRPPLGRLGTWLGRFALSELIEARVMTGDYALVSFAPTPDGLQPTDTFAYPLADVPVSEWNPSYTTTSGETMRREKVPFREGHEWALDGEGYVWTGDTRSGRIVLKTFQGDIVQQFDVPVGPTISRAERDSAIAGAKARAPSFDPDDVPDRKPAFRALVPLENGGLLLVREGGGGAWCLMELRRNGVIRREAPLPIVPDLTVPPTTFAGRIWLVARGPYDAPAVHAFEWQSSGDDGPNQLPEPATVSSEASMDAARPLGRVAASRASETCREIAS